MAGGYPSDHLIQMASSFQRASEVITEAAFMDAAADKAPNLQERGSRQHLEASVVIFHLEALVLALVTRRKSSRRLRQQRTGPRRLRKHTFSPASQENARM